MTRTWEQNDAITAISGSRRERQPEAHLRQGRRPPRRHHLHAARRQRQSWRHHRGHAHGARLSGTITIRATNTQGSDDWTVDYETEAPPPPGILRSTVGGWGVGQHAPMGFHAGRLLIPPALVAGGGTAYLRKAGRKLHR